MTTTDAATGSPASAPDGELTDRERYYRAGPWRLMWWRFRKHKVARWSLYLLLFLYLMAAFAEFFAPYGSGQRFEGYSNASPTRVHLSHNGEFRGPFVYDRVRKLDLDTLDYTYAENTSAPSALVFFGRGTPYRILGLVETDRHLVTTAEGAAPLFLLGSDRIGRDLFSRIIHGLRVSLTIGLVGVILSFLLGIVLGAISGYLGGVTDSVIQRIIDFVLALPPIPLFMALAAAVPRDWSVVTTYFVITLILSTITWAPLARVVRGKLLSLREEDFVTAARLAGASQSRIMFVHLLPSFTSHLIVALTLNVPVMILSETGLSFVGLGLQAPAVSWGVLLQDAQNVSSVTLYPWLMTPALFVVLTVLLFNFVGDGLRDAADPYSS